MEVGYAVIIQKEKLLKCLPNESSVYRAEVTTIDLALNTIANHKFSKFIIYSDSKSVLLALQNKDTSTPLITKLVNKMTALSKNNSIILTWIPSDISIHGNERIKLQKAILADISNSKILNIGLKPTINKFIHDKWQKSLDDNIHNELHRIQDTIGEWLASYWRNRKEVRLSGLHIGYTHIIHLHLSIETTPICSIYQVPTTIEHLLLNHDRWKETCPKYYQRSNLKDIFKNSTPEDILIFLKKKKKKKKIF